MRRWTRTLLLILALALALGWKATLSVKDAGTGDEAGCANEPARPAKNKQTRVAPPAPVSLPVPFPELAGLTLPVPKGMEPRIRLWLAVYGQYDQNYLIIYNRERPGVIYDAVLDLPGNKQRAIFRVRAMLYLLNQIIRTSEDPLADMAKRPDGKALIELYHKFDYIADKDKFTRAPGPGNIGTLRGRKNELVLAFRRAAPYLPAMEAIFREHGLPPELTRLTFVESMFDREARSDKGALGAWQFLPPAARPYLVMDSARDERRDPIASTRAAAAILARDYERLKSWPLAVTAYNAGVARVIKAVNYTGASSLPVIIREYDHDDFGFSVENFYAKLLAIIAAEKRLGLKPEITVAGVNPLDYDLVPLPSAMTVGRLSRDLGMDQVILTTMNPAWTEAVERELVFIPKGYLLRVPRGSAGLVRATLGIPEPPPGQEFPGPHNITPANTSAINTDLTSRP
jgi:membrane-bound lytic murein transglycosylase D